MTLFQDLKKSLEPLAEPVRSSFSYWKETDERFRQVAKTLAETLPVTILDEISPNNISGALALAEQHIIMYLSDKSYDLPHVIADNLSINNAMMLFQMQESNSRKFFHYVESKEGYEAALDKTISTIPAEDIFSLVVPGCDGFSSRAQLKSDLRTASLGEASFSPNLCNPNLRKNID